MGQIGTKRWEKTEEKQEKKPEEIDGNSAEGGTAGPDIFREEWELLSL